MVTFLQSLSLKHKSLSHKKYFATSHGEGVVDGIGGKAKALVQAKVMSKGDDRIIVQSSKAAEGLLKKTVMIHISQEEISSRVSEVTDSSLTKSESLGLRKNNIHIVIQTFKHSGGGKVAEFSYATVETVKLTIGGCILFAVILLILKYMCSLRFVVYIFGIVFLLFF